jgi:hypothetical protein
VHGIPWAYDDDKLRDIFAPSNLSIVNAEVVYGKDSKSRVRSFCSAAALPLGYLVLEPCGRSENFD